MSMHFIEPILVHFTFVGIHLNVNILATFRFEPRHNLSPEVSRLRKVCLGFILIDERRKIVAVRAGSTKSKPLKAVESTVLLATKAFYSDS